VGTAVFGRESVLVAVDTVLASAQHGLAVLVLEGDPGIGKTTVWREGIARAARNGYRILSCRAAPTEARLLFAIRPLA
jgi:MoxR-like ATPase